MKIELNNLKYNYSHHSQFSLEIVNAKYKFETPLGIFGLSGSGKTTLGKIIAGILLPSEDQCKLDISNPYVLYSDQMAENIFLGSSIEKTIEYISVNNSRVNDLEKKCSDYLKQFHLDLNKIKSKEGNELSVGELRKFALSLALSCEPDLLILDEPTIGLDLKSKCQFQEIVQKYSGKMIVISHDYEILKNICSNLWVMHQGKLIYEGKTNDLEKEIGLWSAIGLDFYTKLIEKRKEIYNKLNFI